MLTFYFSGAEGHMAVPEVLTAGMVGKELRLEFSPEWEGLTKTVVFSNGETTLDRLYTGETMVIPAQVLEKPLEELTVGLYGVSADGTLVIPTVRARGPVILPGVDPEGDPGMDPSLPVWDQLMVMIGRLEDLTTEEKGSLVGAINELICCLGKNSTVDYYGSLSAAVADINDGTSVNGDKDREGAKVAVFTAHTGAKTVLLLEDVAESTQINVLKDLDLALNGKTLSFADPAAYLNFGEGTNCRIFGNVSGSTISKTCDCSAYTSNPRLIYSKANLLEMHGGDYIFRTATQKLLISFNIAIGAGKVVIDGCTVAAENMDTSSVKAVRCIQNDAKCLVVRNTSLSAVNGKPQCAMLYTDGEFENCVMSARAGETSNCVTADDSAVVSLHGCELKSVSTAVNSYALAAVGTNIVHAKDCKFVADAVNCHADVQHAIAVHGYSGSEITLDECYVFGTHSGVSCYGKLYINGGTYTGFCHGGVYVAGAGTGEAFINDAVLNCGNYEGEFDYSGKSAEIYGAMYIGGGETVCDNSAYVDGCTLVGNGEVALVLRGSSGEQNNTVCVSNSNLIAGKVRIDNDTLKLMVGTGTNISNIKIDNPGRAEFSERLYRKNHGDKVLDGCDYAALAEQLENTSGLVKTVGGVAADKNGDVPLEWVATRTFQPKIILEETSVSGGFNGALTYEDMEGQDELAILCDERLYLCVPEFGYSEGDGYFVKIGNQSLLNSNQTDTGEPFLIWGFQGASLILSFRESGTHIMSITGYINDFKKLPAHYLPEDAIREIVAEVLAETQTG